MTNTRKNTHIAGIGYTSAYLADKGINTEIVEDGRKTYLEITDGEHIGKLIGVGALQEHDSYRMAKNSDKKVDYDFIVIVTGLKYTIKKVFLMTEKTARELANDAKSGDDKDGMVIQEELSHYRDVKLG